MVGKQIIKVNVQRVAWKGFNSLCILGAWTIWKHRNACVFEGASPNLQVAVQAFKEESHLWQFSGAEARCPKPWVGGKACPLAGLDHCGLVPTLCVFCNSLFLDLHAPHSGPRCGVFYVFGPLLFSLNTNIRSSPACSRKKKVAWKHNCVPTVRWESVCVLNK